MTNLILRQDSLIQIFNPNAFLFFLLTGDTCYHHAIYMVFTYFAPFTSYEDDFLEVISNLNVLESKFDGKNFKFGGKSFKKLNAAELMEFVFSKSALHCNALRRSVTICGSCCLSFTRHCVGPSPHTVSC